MNDKIVGIIGGMGPEATAFYYMKFVKKTKVHKDQDHFRVIIDGNSKIPDRTKAILNGDTSPLQEIRKCVETLNKTKVDIGFIPCITSHYFIDEIRKNTQFILVDALEELNRHIKKQYSDQTKIGILATTGTGKTGIFDKRLNHFHLIYPDEQQQENKVMKAIYSPKFGIKGGYTQGQCIDLLKEAGKDLILKGAEVLIAGCTEIGMVMDQLEFSVPLLDPMDCAIEKIINEK